MMQYSKMEREERERKKKEQEGRDREKKTSSEGEGREEGEIHIPELLYAGSKPLLIMTNHFPPNAVLIFYIDDFRQLRHERMDSYHGWYFNSLLRDEYLKKITRSY